MLTFPEYSRHGVDSEHGLQAVFEFQQPHPCENPDAISESIIAAFARCENDKPDAGAPPGTDIWTSLIQRHHAEIVRIVQSRDAQKVSAYMAKMHETSLCTGMLDTGCSPDPKQREAWGATIFSHFLAIAEAIGVVPLFSPFGTAVDLNLHCYEADTLLAGIEATLGQQISIPATLGGFGIRTRRGIVTDRIARALLTAIQIRDTCRLLDIDFASAKICEIGGGGGLLAYYCWQLGARNYTIFDLPTVNIIQNHVLLGALPEATVPYSQYETIDQPGIKILPFWRIQDCLETQIDLFVNEDSLPEIDSEISMAYLHLIRHSARYFLSLNQECSTRENNGHVQQPVFELVRAAGGYERLLRNLHWSCRGYAMELYRIKQEAKSIDEPL